MEQEDGQGGGGTIILLAELYTTIVLVTKGTPECVVDIQHDRESRLLVDKINLATVEVDLVGYPEDAEVTQALESALQRGVNVYVIRTVSRNLPNYAVIDNRIVLVGSRNGDWSNDYSMQDCHQVGAFVQVTERLKKRSRPVGN